MEQSAEFGIDPERMGPGKRGIRSWTSAGILRVRILFSSYTALSVILFLRVHPLPLKVAFGALALIGFGDAIRLTWLAPRGFARPRVEAVRDAGGEVAGYLATYLLPLLAAPDPDRGTIIAYAVYGVIIAIVTLRSELAHVNPMIYLMGWRVVTVRLEGEKRSRYLVCRRAPKPGTKVQVTDLVGVLHSVE